MTPGTLIALALFALGLAVAFLGRWMKGAGAWARAILLTALALAGTLLAWNFGQVALWWISGFLVCAALHRWVEAAGFRLPHPEPDAAPRPRRKSP